MNHIDSIMDSELHQACREWVDGPDLINSHPLSGNLSVIGGSSDKRLTADGKATRNTQSSKIPHIPKDTKMYRALKEYYKINPHGCKSIISKYTEDETMRDKVLKWLHIAERKEDARLARVWGDLRNIYKKL